MKTSTGSRQVLLSRIVLFAGIALLLAGMLLVALPEILRLALPSLLAKRGLDASVEHVMVDPWNGEVALFGVRLATPANLVLRFAELRAGVDMSALLAGDTSALRRLGGRGGEVDSDQLADIRWGGGGGNTDLRTIPLPHMNVRDVALKYLSALLGREISLQRLSLMPPIAGGGPAKLRILIAVDQGSVAVDGDIVLDAETLSLTAGLEIAGLELEGLAPLSGGALARLAGQVNGTAAIQADMNASTGALRVSIEGKHRVAGLELAREDLQASVDATYDGSVSMARPTSAQAPEIVLAGAFATTALRSRWHSDGVAVEVSGDGLNWKGELALGVAGPRGRGTLDWAQGRVAVDAEYAPALVALLGRLASVGDDVQKRLASARRPVDFQLSGVAAELSLPEPPAPGAVTGGAAPLLLSIPQLRADTVTLAGREGLPPATARNLVSEKVALLDDGALLFEAIRSDVLEARAAGEEPAWQAAGIALEGVSRQADGAVSWRKARIERVATRAPAGAISLDGIEAHALQRDVDGGVTLQTLSLMAAALPFPGQGMALESATVDKIVLDRDGGLRADAVQAGRVELRTDGQPPSQLQDVAVKQVRVEADYRLSAAVVDLAQAQLELPQAAVLLKQGRVSELAVDDSGAAAAAGLSVGMLSAKGREGKWQAAAGDLVVATLALSLPQQLSVASMRASALTYAESGSDSVRIGDVRTRDFRMSGADAARSVTLAQMQMADASATTANGEQALNLGALKAQRLQVAGDGAVEVGQIQVEGAAVGSKTQSRLTFQALTLETLQVDKAGLVSLEAGTVTDMDALLVRGEKGALLLLPIPFSRADPPASPNAKPIAVVIRRLQTQGNTRMAFSDRSVTPPFDAQATELKLSVESLDTRLASAAGQVELQGALGKFSALKLNAQQRADGGQRVIEFNGRITGADLTRLTPYVRNLQDARVRSGRADLRIKGVLSGTTLDAGTDVVLSKLELEATNAVPAASPESMPAERTAPGVKTADKGRSGNMPLSAALALLRDKEGNVRLKIPVSGPLDDPDFDFSDAVGQAVAKAAQAAVLLVFQPVGILMTAASALGGLDGDLSMAPVVFPAQESDIPADGLTRLETLSLTLKQKAGVSVHVCGRAVPAELAALAGDTQAALALARERSDRVRAYLLEQGVTQAQLPACEARVEPADTAGAPRVDLGLVLPGVSPSKQPRARGTER